MNNLTTTLQGQIQNMRDTMNKTNDERNNLKKELETKNQEIQEKARTITQVKKIGRRYKTQYDELKVQHEKVSFFLLFFKHFKIKWMVACCILLDQ